MGAPDPREREKRTYRYQEPRRNAAVVIQVVHPEPFRAIPEVRHFRIEIPDSDHLYPRGIAEVLSHVSTRAVGTSLCDEASIVG